MKTWQRIRPVFLVFDVKIFGDVIGSDVILVLTLLFRLWSRGSHVIFFLLFSK
jgi:hypothetical protein